MPAVLWSPLPLVPEGGLRRENRPKVRLAHIVKQPKGQTEYHFLFYPRPVNRPWVKQKESRKNGAAPAP